MSIQLKFSDQETKVINYLTSRNNGNVFWEELTQFAKNPQTVKLKTVKKTVSEIKRKYTAAGLSIPFKVSLTTMGGTSNEPETEEEDDESVVTVSIDGSLPFTPGPPKQQTLVQVKRASTPNVTNTSAPNGASQAPPTTTHPAHTDFVLDRLSKRVRTKYGSHNLNDNEWEVFKYFHNNVGKLIPISELRDKVIYPQYGSKLPARWFDAIMRIINNMRRQIPTLDRRLLTVKSSETSYLFQ